ncbi:MAG TPA: leucyl aminopeptidase, partial [Roseovarius sp.]|nr:leucyl aminopeptidase [Roseovarius sp.]
MTTPVAVTFKETDNDAIAEAEGRVAIIVTPDGKLDTSARRVNRLTRGAVKRLAESEGWGKMKPGQVKSLTMPAGVAAEAVDVVCLPRRATVEEARKAGVALGKIKGDGALLLMAGSLRRVAELALGVALRAYAFTARKTAPVEEAGAVTVMTNNP